MDPNYLDDLIRKYADDTATPEEIEDLLEWYRSIHSVPFVEWPATYPDEKEDLHQRMLQRLEQQLHPLEHEFHPLEHQLTPSEPARPVHTPSPHPRPLLPLPRIHHRPWLRVAASLILIAGTWLLWQSLRPHETAWLTVHNSFGKIQNIRLPDNSQVWLNAASTLRYAKDFHQQRELYLEGEAYFDVTEEKTHPFTVHAGELTTTVLGTGFDIKSFATDSLHLITVIRGKVSVAHEGKVVDQLTAARQLQWDHQTGQSQTISVDTNQVLGWQQGQLIFKGQTMEEIAAGLGRWYNVRFEFKDTAMRRCRFYINFKNTIPLKDLLTTLSYANGMSFTIDDKNHIVTLSGKGCQ
jgi:ferric-dicitrate binding protein FerR (iron transport regulator)